MIQKLLARPNELIVIALVLLSVGAWYFFYSFGLTTIYNDAMSHLDVARLVFDNKQPGLSQLGSVWLPMSHILTLPFIGNNSLWHTGFAGSIISMAAYVISVITIFKIVILLSGSRTGGVIAGLIFALNLNLLYLQSTPLTEPLYICFFLLSAFFALKYLNNNSINSLIALGVTSGLGILTRYDAWFVAVIFALLIVINELVIKKRKIPAVLGYFVLYAFPVVFAAVLWLGWNLIIFGDPLYSFIGPYSAHAQQAVINNASGLITKNNISESSWAFLLTVLRNIGLIISILGVLGWGIYLAVSKYVPRHIRIFSCVILSSIIVFNILALFLGFSILNLPELHWNPSGTEAGELFNVRYGILALPFMAIGSGLLIARVKYKKLVAVAAVALILLQSVMIYDNGIITIEDGERGSSAFVNQDIANSLKTHVKPDDTVIMSTSSYNAVAFRSGLNLNQFIHEGVSSEWKAALARPERYAKWIVMANNDVGEPVHEQLVNKQHNGYLNSYTKVYTGAYASLYERK